VVDGLFVYEYVKCVLSVWDFDDLLFYVVVCLELDDFLCV